MNLPFLQEDPTPTLSARGSRAFTARQGLLTLVVVIGAFKLLLVANQEIVLESCDALGYVSQANQIDVNFGLGATGYTVWLWLVKLLSIPQRIGIELLWLTSAGFLSFSIFPRGRKRWMVLPVFLAAALIPQTYYLFDRALTDGYYLCLSAMALGFSIRALCGSNLRVRLPSLAGLGVFIGLMAITRNEGILLLSFLVGWAVLLGVHDWRSKKKPAKDALIGAIRTLAVAGAFAIVIPTGLVLHNGWRYGVFTLNFPEMPSHMRLLKSLAAIDTGEPNPRFVPISRKAREMAYTQSPTLARFREEVENPANIYHKSSQAAIGLPGEIGGGWIWHVFNAAAPSLGITSFQVLDSTYRQATVEINEGFRSGKLQRRFVPHPFLGKDISMWAPHLGSGFLHALKCVIEPIWPMDDAELTPFERSMFDRACLRRISLANNTVRIQGWVFSKNPDFPITGISTSEGSMAKDAASVSDPRLDVQQTQSKGDFKPPSGCGFTLSTTILKRGDWFVLSLFSGSELVGKSTEFESGKTYLLAGKHGEIVMRIDVLAPSYRDKSSLMEQFKVIALRLASSAPMWAFGLLLGFAGLLVFLFVRQSSSGCPWLAEAAIVAVWAASRLMFYSLISAAAWEAEPRYLQNTAVFGILALVVLTVGATDRVAHMLLDSRSSKRSTHPHIDPAGKGS